MNIEHGYLVKSRNIFQLISVLQLELRLVIQIQILCIMCLKIKRLQLRILMPKMLLNFMRAAQVLIFTSCLLGLITNKIRRKQIMEHFLPNKNYSLMHIKIMYVRLIYNMCCNGNIKLKKPKSRTIPFNRDLEVARAKTEWQKYLNEQKKAS